MVKIKTEYNLRILCNLRPSKLIFNNSFKEKLTREEAAQLLTNSEREQSFFYEFKFSQLVFSLPLNGPRAKFKTKLSVQPVFFRFSDIKTRYFFSQTNLFKSLREY